MSTNQIQKIFNYEGSQVRTVIVNGEPWFVAKDVCAVLGITSNAVTNQLQKLPPEMRCLNPIKTPNRTVEVNCINEAGLYRLTMRSDKPQAQAFQNWIASEVLPSIRKHGMYMTKEVAHEAIENVELFLSRALLIAKDKIDVLQIQLDEAAPKVLFADSVTASETSIPVGDLAKILRQNGIEIGQNRLFEWLRENGYLMKASYSRHMPTQKSMERGLFEIEESTEKVRGGITKINGIAKVTGKGQLYFVNLFRRKSA